MASNDTTDSFSINDFGRKTKEVPKGAKLIYFKFVGSVREGDIAKAWDIPPDKFARIMETDISGGDLSEAEMSMYNKKVQILDAVEQVGRLSRAAYQDEYGQIAAGSKRPHMKYSSSKFRERIAETREECIEHCAVLPGEKAGQCPTFRVFYRISETTYKKEIKALLVERAKTAGVSIELFENLDKLVPIEDKVKGEALEKIETIRQSMSGDEKIKRPDPDMEIHESIFTDKEQRRAQRRLRNQIQSSRPF